MREGNVFTPVCHSVYRGVSASGSRGCTPPRHTPCWADTPQVDTPLATYTARHTPPPRHTPRADTPSGHNTPPGHKLRLGRHYPWTHPPSGKTPHWADTPVEMTIEAGGTHPTGMYSCYRKVYSLLENLSRSFEISKNITVIDWKFNWPNNLKSIYKNLNIT